MAGGLWEGLMAPPGGPRAVLVHEEAGPLVAADLRADAPVVPAPINCSVRGRHWRSEKGNGDGQGWGSFFLFRVHGL